MLEKVKTNYGFDMYVDTKFDQGLELSILNTGTYESGTLDIISKCLCQGDVFIDVGANIGLMTLMALRSVGVRGRVISFEPVRSTFALLKINVPVFKYNAILVNKALGNKTGLFPIYTHDENRGGASLVTFEDRPYKELKKDFSNWKGNKELCDVIKLDAWFEDNKNLNFNKINMLKIDTEGSELDVLKGACETIKKYLPIICIEYSGKDIMDFLSNFGYRFYILEKTKANISRLLPISNFPDNLTDNIFCFNEKHFKDHILGKRLTLYIRDIR